MGAEPTTDAGSLAAASELARWARAESIPCLLRGEPGFAAAAPIYNLMHDGAPVAIVQPRGDRDVAAVLAWAAESRIAVAVRGGGHHVGGFGTYADGIVLSLSAMRGARLEADGAIVTVEGGSRLGELDRYLSPRGLVVPTGTVSDTGIGGLALGGGIGWLVGSLGLTCDSIVGADVALPDGRIVAAEEAGNEDLLWFMRGAGGGCGVVTRFRFKTHRLPSCHVGIATAAADPGVLATVLSHLSADCPPELTVAPLLRRDDRGDPVLCVEFCLGGDDLTGIDDLLRRIPQAEVSICREAEYTSWQSHTDDQFLAPRRGYWKSAYFAELDLSRADLLVDHLRLAPPGIEATILVEHLHGRFHGEGPQSGAFPIRAARLGFLFSARWVSPKLDEAGRGWVRAGVQILDPDGKAGAYSNYSPADDERVTRDLVSSAGRLERLLGTKRRFDPHNVLALSHVGRLMAAGGEAG
jgi:FAD/FMN-containing dehydrogenase